MYKLFSYKHGRAKIDHNQINDLEEKFREAMINNPQLDNEKQSYLYQIEKLKDDFEELEENYCRLQRDFKDKSRVSPANCVCLPALISAFLRKRRFEPVAN